MVTNTAPFEKMKRKRKGNKPGNRHKRTLRDKRQPKEKYGE